MSTDQAKLSDISGPSPRERVLSDGARYRGETGRSEAPTGNHGGGSCGNCGATEDDLDGMGKEWWRVFAPRGGPENGCLNCMGSLQQQTAAIATGERELEDIQGGER